MKIGKTDLTEQADQLAYNGGLALDPGRESRGLDGVNLHPVTSCDRTLHLGQLCRRSASDTKLRYATFVSDSTQGTAKRQSAFGFCIHAKTISWPGLPLVKFADANSTNGRQSADVVRNTNGTEFFQVRLIRIKIQRKNLQVQ